MKYISEKKENDMSKLMLSLALGVVAYLGIAVRVAIGGDGFVSATLNGNLWPAVVGCQTGAGTPGMKTSFL